MTNVTTNLSLKSLNNRLSALENQSAPTSASTSTSTNPSLSSALVSAAANATSTQLDLVTEHFQNGVTKSFPDTGIGFLSYVVQYTVTYVETNISQIAQILNTNVSGNLKLQIALSFLQNYYQGLDMTFLTNIIEHMVDLLFNKAESTAPSPSVLPANLTAPPPTPTSRSLKSKFGSIRIAFKKKSG